MKGYDIGHIFIKFGEGNFISITMVYVVLYGMHSVTDATKISYIKHERHNKVINSDLLMPSYVITTKKKCLGIKISSTW